MSEVVYLSSIDSLIDIQSKYLNIIEIGNIDIKHYPYLTKKKFVAELITPIDRNEISEILGLIYGLFLKTNNLVLVVLEETDLMEDALRFNEIMETSNTVYVDANNHNSYGMHTIKYMLERNNYISSSEYIFLAKEIELQENELFQYK